MINDLANQVDAILHTEAPVGGLCRSNILGTHKILHLSSRGHGKVVRFIPTIWVTVLLTMTESMAGIMIVAARFRGAKAV